ncbi:MAG: DUF3540 domain-containing protein [Syntrophales bacterium]
MLSLAKKLEATQPSLEYCRVTSREGACFIVAGAFGKYRAETAVSCLLAPHVGDEVLTVFNGEKDCYILSVLKRQAEKVTSNELLFSGPVQMHVQDGGFNLSSAGTISFAAATELAMAAPKMTLHAGQAQATVERFSFLSSFFNGTVKEAKVVAGKVEHVFQRLTERLTNSCRFVTEHEEIQTGSTRYLVEENLTMHSKNAMHVAEELVSINAEQIHLC